MRELYCAWGDLKYFQMKRQKDVFNLAVRRMCIYTQELEMGQVNSSIRTGVLMENVLLYILFCFYMKHRGKISELCRKTFCCHKKIFFLQDVNYGSLWKCRSVYCSLKLYQIKRMCGIGRSISERGCLRLKKFMESKTDHGKGSGWKLSSRKASGGNGLWKQWIFNALYCPVSDNRKQSIKKNKFTCEYENSLYL